MGSKHVQDRDRVRAVSQVFGPVPRTHLHDCQRTSGPACPLFHLFGRSPPPVETGVRSSGVPGSPRAVTHLPDQPAHSSALSDAPFRGTESDTAGSSADAFSRQDWCDGAVDALPILETGSSNTQTAPLSCRSGVRKCVLEVHPVPAEIPAQNPRYRTSSCSLPLEQPRLPSGWF